MTRLATAAMLVLATGVAAADAAFDALAARFRRDLADPVPAKRLAAFDPLRESADPRVADLLVAAGDGLERERRTLLARRERTEEDLEAAISSEESEIASFARKAGATEIEAVRHRQRISKLRARRGELSSDLAAAGDVLEGVDGLLYRAVATLGAVLSHVPLPDLAPALARVETAWAGPSSDAFDRERFVAALERTDAPAAAQRLRAILLDEPAREPRLRVAALLARAARGDGGVLEDAIGCLADPSWQVEAAAIDVLRRLHRREGVEPLIEFLGREDVGRLREDAHRALRSLTGRSHGPYREPWRTWWDAKEPGFPFPERPAEVADLLQPEKGVTFYGITTFSRRVLFVLDVSESMLDPGGPSGKAASERKIDAARRELIGAVASLDDGSRFAMHLFGHRLSRWQEGMAKADRSTREQARRFAEAIEPAGGTNLHDALETALRMAGLPGSDGRFGPAVVDTVFFLTDGRPSAGKVQEPRRILAAVASWNRLCRVTIHCVGLGSHDPQFLSALASQNGGRYVKR